MSDAWIRKAKRIVISELPRCTAPGTPIGTGAFITTSLQDGGQHLGSAFSDVCDAAERLLDADRNNAMPPGECSYINAALRDASFIASKLRPGLLKILQKIGYLRDNPQKRKGQEPAILRIVDPSRVRCRLSTYRHALVLPTEETPLHLSSMVLRASSAITKDRCDKLAAELRLLPRDLNDLGIHHTGHRVVNQRLRETATGI